jgi:hypothetical protein
MDSVTIGIRDGRVAVLNNTVRMAVSLSWRAAVVVATAMALKARRVIGPEREMFGTISVERDGNNVLVAAQGKTFLLAPCAAAIEIAGAIKQQARRLEEIECAERIAYDQAILQRSGRPFGLTNHPKIQDEAGKEAAWNSDLRRYIPAGRLRQTQVGTPRVTRQGGELWKR